MKKISIIVITLVAALSSTSAFAATTRDLKVQDLGATVKVNVHTGGCTEKSSFAVDNVASGSPAVVTLKRTKGDACEAWFPEGIWLTFDKSEFGLKTGDALKVQEKLD